MRDGAFSTELVARSQRSEPALVLALARMELVVSGISTRNVTRISEELCSASFSKSTVSTLCAQLDPLAEQAFPLVLVDALVLEVRDDEGVPALSGLLAIGVNAPGYREILGLQLGNGESAASWSSFLGRLKHRGLAAVDLVVSDAHGGLVRAIAHHLQVAPWQGCQTHLTRDVLEAAPKALRNELHEHLRVHGGRGVGGQL